MIIIGLPAMNVSAIHAMPNKAIAATMPAESNGCFEHLAGSIVVRPAG